MQFKEITFFFVNVSLIKKSIYVEPSWKTAVNLLHAVILDLGHTPVPATKDIVGMEKRAKVSTLHTYNEIERCF